MRINLQHLNLRAGERLERWIEEEILALGEARRIDEASVRLECRSDSSPPFGVRIHLETPGPDVFAECHDHTLRAAFAKAIAQLRETVTTRAAKRLGRSRGRAARWVARGRSAGLRRA